MSVPEDWVERLALATDYRQLHELFAAMSSAARRSEEPERLAACIDEALLRLRRERARDEDELREIEAGYEQFKDEQSGVLGWLRRHLPFTETRRQDKAHRAELADQEAEILADNLFIARSQMLKETLLPPGRSALGDEPEDWERRLAADERGSRIRAYAQNVATLARELRRGAGFVDDVQVDIDAFAKAEFTDEDDRRRGKADLSAAREELGGLERTLRAKRDLHEGAVDRLRGLITRDLEESDPSFCALSRRASRLDEALAQATRVATGLESAHDALSEMQEAAAGFEELNEKRLELARELGRSREAHESAERRRIRADTLAAERAGRADAAGDALRRAESALRSARSAHESYVAASGQVELPENVAFEDSSPAAAELVRAEAALAAAREAQEEAAARYEEARSEAAAAEREVADARRELEQCERDEDALARDERDLRSAWDDAVGRLRPRVDEMPGFVENYEGMLAKLDRRSPLSGHHHRFGRRSRFEFARDAAFPEAASDIEDAVKRMGDLLAAARADRASLEEDRVEVGRRIDSVWAQRSQELLGDELASEVF